MNRICKRDGCREPTVGFNVKTEGFKLKPYCEKHYEAYKSKQKEYRELRKTFPDCRSGISIDCEGKVSSSRQSYGKTMCRNCEEEMISLERKERKNRLFQQASTVDELKEWIKEYML